LTFISIQAVAVCWRYRAARDGRLTIGLCLIICIIIVRPSVVCRLSVVCL